MIAVTQNVQRADVKVNDKLISEIKAGLLIFLGIDKEDTKIKADWLIDKIMNHRMFRLDSHEDKIQASILDIKGEVLIVSQFTLSADNSKGRKPSFSDAMSPKDAEELYMCFVDVFREKSGLTVRNGSFGEYMQVSLINDGPFTLIFNK